MKLPEDKKERTKIIIMIVVGVIAVIYAIFELAILPLLTSQHLNQKKLADSQAKIKKIKRDLLHVPALKADFNAVSTQITNLSSHLAQSVLGTYLLGIQNTLDSLAANFDIKMNPAGEIGIAELPGNNKDGSAHSLRSYSVRVIFYGGYQEAMNFFKALEASNPMMCITEFSINPQPASPEQHQINFTAQWPIWVEVEKPSVSDVIPVEPSPAAIPAPASSKSRRKSTDEIAE